LSLKTKAELLELIERQDKLLANKWVNLRLGVLVYKNKLRQKERRIVLKRSVINRVCVVKRKQWFCKFWWL
jgi:hypothetical protein